MIILYSLHYFSAPPWAVTFIFSGVMYEHMFHWAWYSRYWFGLSGFPFCSWYQCFRNSITRITLNVHTHIQYNTVSPSHNDSVGSQRCCHLNEFAILTRRVCETHSCPHPGTIVNKGLINNFHNMLKMGICVKHVYHIKNWNSAE